MPADRIGASARDPGKAADLIARGVRVRHGDFGQPTKAAIIYKQTSGIPSFLVTTAETALSR